MVARLKAPLVLCLALVLISIIGASAQNLWQTLPPPTPTPEPSATGTVAHEGAALYYAVHGAGPSVVLLHGGMGNADHWAGQVGALRERYRLVTMDSRGHGRSTWDGKPLGYHLMASDVLAVMDHLDIEAAAIVGWSDGGNIGLDLAINHPGRVSRLFVFGANFHPSGLKAPPAGSATFPNYLKRATADLVRLSSEKNRLAGMLKALRKMWRTEPAFTEAELSAIRAPVVIAHAEHDEIVRRDHSERLTELVPGARLRLLPGVSHFALWQDPAAFNAAVLEFLAAD